MQIDENEGDNCRQCRTKSKSKIQSSSQKQYHAIIQKQIEDLQYEQISLRNLISCFEKASDLHLCNTKAKQLMETKKSYMQSSEDSCREQDQEISELKQQIARLEDKLIKQSDINQKLSLKIYDTDDNLLTQLNKTEISTHERAVGSSINELKYQQLSEQHYRLTHCNILDMLFDLKIQQSSDKKTFKSYINCQLLTMQNIWKLLPAMEYIFQYGCPKIHQRKHITIIDMENQIIIAVKEKNNEQQASKKSKKYEEIDLQCYYKWLPYALKEVLNFLKSVSAQYQSDSLSHCQEIVKELIEGIGDNQLQIKTKVKECIIQKLVRIVTILFKWIQQFSEI